MVQEDKELLLQDLCARLPYGVTIQGINPDGEIIVEELFTISSCFDCNMIEIHSIKPYLFPLSSMTEEQKIECFRGIDIEIDDYNEIWSKFPITNNDIILTNIRDWLKVIDWLNKNHFDYRGLIPKGLALDATGFNIY